MTDSAPRFSRPLARGTRRTLVVLAAALAALVLVLTQFDGSIASGAFWLALLAWMLIVVRVDRSLQCLPARSEDRLDERELELRNASYGRAYRIVSGIGVACLVAGIMAMELAQRGRLGADPSTVLLMLLVAYVAVVLNLPWMTLAWRVPDPIAETDA